MKTSIIKLLSISCMVTTFCSCSKETLISNGETATLSKPIQQSINAGSITAIKQTYSLLTAVDKQTLWDKKWQTVLKNDGDRLTSEQKKIVNMIKNFVDNKTIDALIKDPRDGEKFLKINLPYFEKHFSAPELYLLIECSYFTDNFSIFKATDYLSVIDERVNNKDNVLAEVKCSCLYSISCYVSGDGSCLTSNNTCTRNANCGLTGSSNCTGTCSNA